MKKFSEFVKEKMASMESQQRISNRIFASARFKEKDGEFVPVTELEANRTYQMYNPEGTKKIGWIKTPDLSHGVAGYGWCNLPGYLALPKVPEEYTPFEVRDEAFDEINPEDFGLNDVVDEYRAEYRAEYTESIPDMTNTEELDTEPDYE